LRGKKVTAKANAVPRNRKKEKKRESLPAGGRPKNRGPGLKKEKKGNNSC